MNKSTFVYVTYIRTTAEKLWDALTKPEFTRKYWQEVWQDSTWQKGSSWKLMIPDGRIGDAGEIIEIDKPRRLVLRWRNQFRPELHAEGDSICTMELEPQTDCVRLTITHEMEGPGTKLIDAVSQGWPKILSSLKTMLETGESLESTRQWPKGM